MVWFLDNSHVNSQHKELEKVIEVNQKQEKINGKLKKITWIDIISRNKPCKYNIIQTNK